MSAGSRTYPGAYKNQRENLPDKQQFTIGDTRPLDEVVYDLVDSLRYIPSFCTACYRLGRTGDHFMGLAKTAFINKFCHPNALLTFKEYLEDYAPEPTKIAGNALIATELAGVSDNSRRVIIEERLERIYGGERDIYC
jgi:2-iminoacetate synthase